MTSIVAAEELSKTFQVKVRDPGLRGAVRALFRPRYRDGARGTRRDVPHRAGRDRRVPRSERRGQDHDAQMLAGLLYPTSGRVEAAGFVPWTGGPPFKRRIASCSATGSSSCGISLRRRRSCSTAIYDIPEVDYRARLAELVTLLDLGDVLQKPVRQLSLGERMKCELVASLLHRRRCCFSTSPRWGWT